MNRAASFLALARTMTNSRGIVATKLTPTRPTCVGLALVALLAVVLFVATRPTHAAARVASVSGNWSSTTTWGGAAVPTSADTVTINHGVTVTVDVSNAVCASVLLNEAINGTATLSFNNGSQLTVGGTVQFGNGGNKFGAVDMSSGGTLICTGFVQNQTPTWTPGMGTVQFTATNTLPAGFTSFNNLIISGGTTTLGVNLNSTAAGTLTVKAGATLALSTFTYGATTPPASLTMEDGATTGASITGTGALTLGGNVTVNSAGTGSSGATISCPVALTNTATRTFAVADDGTSATDLTISGIISTSGSLTKAGAGTMVMSGVNTYTGVTTVNAGVLSVGTIGNGGVAGNLGQATNAAANLVLDGGTLRYTGGSASTDRAFTLTAATTSSIDISTGGTTLTISGGGAATTGALTKIGAGTLVLSGANSYTGVTAVSNGTLSLGGANNGNSTIVGDITINGGTLNYSNTSDDQIANTSNMTLSSGTFNPAARTETIGSLTMTGGSLTKQSGTLTLANSSSITGGTLTFSAGTASMATNNALALGGATFNYNVVGTAGTNNLNLGGDVSYAATGTAPAVFANTNTGVGDLQIGSSGTRTFNITQASPALGQAEVQIAWVVTQGGATALTKSGTGALQLSGANTYTGGTTLSAGTLNINNAQALGTVAGTFTISGGTIDNTSGGALTTLNYPQAWNGDFTFTGTNALNLGTGAVSLNANRQVTVSASTLTVGGTISAATRDLTKAGVGTLSFGANAVTVNSLTINAGTLDQGAAANVTSGTTTVASGATFMNLGTGHFTVGAGGVSNSGTINFNANGTPCGDPDDIVIASSSPGTQRTWAGTGTFSMIDVTVSDQKVPGSPNPPLAILVNSGTNAGNNTGWVFVNQCTSGTYTWIGGTVGANTDWQVSTNWSPTRVTPATADILIFDGNSTPAPTVTNVPTQTDAALRLTNGVNGVTLNAATVPGGTKTLTLSGSTGTDLSAPSGTLLTLSGSTALQISVASGSTGTVGGQIIVTGGAHRVLGNAASAITFQSGSIFTTSSGFTGNAFGTTNAGSIVFASGAVYAHNAGSSPFGTVGGSAVVVFQTGSEADYFTATGFDANGRTYANLVIGKVDPSGVAVAASDSGTGNFQFDNLTINAAGTTNSSLTFTGSGTGAITIKGNITSNGTGTGTLPDVTLTPGSGGITIDKPSSTITFGNDGSNSRSVNLSGNGTVTSTTTLALSRIVQLGLINPNSQTLTVDGTITGGATGYIIGSLKKSSVPTGSFTFPVGTPNGYSPLDTNVTAGTGALTVSATQSTEPSVNASTSLKRYWTLAASGTSVDFTSDLTFHYLDPTDIAGTEANYRIIRVESGTAVSFPNSCPSGNACVDPTNNKATIKSVTGFSDWTLGEQVAPTAVRLTGFTATTRDDGVRLEWRSGFEADNLGYSLYRYQDGQRTRVTPSLIAGSSLIRKHGSELASGFSYGWFDPQGTVGTLYELQAIDLHGNVQVFTPNNAAKSGSQRDPKKAQAMTLSEISAAGAGDAVQHGWANGATHASAKQTTPASAQSLATQQWIASQPAVKLRVNQTGWYRITQPQLVANGLDPSANARNLQLYADGAEVPILLSTNQSTLDSGDTLEFYGVGLDEVTTDTHVYYLVSGTRNGLRIPINQEKGNGKKNEVLAPDFLYTVESKERIEYFPGLLNGDKGNIFGQFIESVPANQTVTLQNIDINANAAAQLEVILQGLTEVPHQIQVQFNGSYVGTINFSGTTNKSTTLQVSATLLREGANTVTLTAMGGDLDYGAVDLMRVTYAHTYRADNDSLSFSVGDRSAFVGGFSSAAIRVLDITNPSVVQELNPKISNSGGSYGFTIQTSGTVQNLVAFVDSLARQPASIVRNAPSTWNASTNAADMLIVTHGDFRSSADTLAAARRAQGLKVSIVDVEDVYDEFSYGAHTPQAVKDFLAWSNSHWAKAPRYVLLFGDSSWDPRNYMGQGYNDFVPTKQVDTAELETASDDWLADFDGDGIPEIALGRLPARTAGEASTMVSKILNYDQERASGAPLRGALLVSDRGFESQSAQVQSYLTPLTTVQTLNRSAIGNDTVMRTEIVNAIDQGPTIVNYFGHGSVTVWTGAGLLNENNASALTNGSRPSLFVMMTCLNGYADDAYIDSLAEIVLKNPQGGAFAVWASSGITVPVGQAQMNTQFYQLLLGNNPMTLGEAARQAKMATTDFDVRRTWVLLGDPSMRLK